MASPATIAANVMTYGFDSNTYLTRATAWVREGLADIVRHVDIPLCFQLVEDTIPVTGVLATDQAAARNVNPSPQGTIIRVENVFDITNDAQLQVGNRGAVEARIANGEYGLPEFYVWLGEALDLSEPPSVLSIAPIPDVETKLAVTFFVAPTAGGTTEDVVCTVMERALEAYGCYRAFQTQDDAEMANYWYSQYELARKGYAHQYNQSAKQVPRQVPGTWSDPALP